MFSPTTIASSTITPITNRIAKKDRKFSDTPNIGRTAKPPANAVMMPIVTQKATIGRKNRMRTIRTRMRPRSAELEMICMLPRYMSASSNRRSALIASGRSSSLARSMNSIRFLEYVSIYIVSGGIIMMKAVGSPSNVVLSDSSTNPSMTFATSPTRMVSPVGS